MISNVYVMADLGILLKKESDDATNVKKKLSKNLCKVLLMAELQAGIITQGKGFSASRNGDSRGYVPALTGLTDLVNALCELSKSVGHRSMLTKPVMGETNAELA